MSNAKTTKASPDRTDWARLRAMPEAEIERLAAADLENSATVSDDEWAQATVGLPASKTSIHASLDKDVVDWFRSQGRGYQTRMNAVLRRYMEAHREIDRKHQ